MSSCDFLPLPSCLLCYLFSHYLLKKKKKKHFYYFSERLKQVNAEENILLLEGVGRGGRLKACWVSGEIKQIPGAGREKKLCCHLEIGFFFFFSGKTKYHRDVKERAQNKNGGSKHQQHTSSAPPPTLVKWKSLAAFFPMLTSVKTS